MLLLRDRNSIYNFLGSAVIALSAVAAAPFYFRFLGPEAFGLIGVSYVVMAFISILDIGLTPTVQREVAMMSAQPDGNVQLKSAVTTLGIVSLFFSVLAGAIGTLSIFFLDSANWIGASDLDRSVLNYALLWIVTQAALQVFITFCGGALLGLQHQSRYNLIFAGIAFLRAVISVFLLWSVQLDVVSFFFLQASISVIHMLIVSTNLVWVLRKGYWQINFKILSDKRKFIIGMLGVSIMAILLTQIDKAILGSSLGLKEFGYYILVWNISMLVIKPAQPIYNAYLPVFSQLASSKDKQKELADVYHNACKRNAMLIWPIAILLALLSYPILVVYTGSSSIAGEIFLALSILSIGSALNATALLPYALTQAHGWVSYSIWQNIIAFGVMLPICYLASIEKSLVIAAIGWFTINLGYVTFSIIWLHKHVLKGHMAQWYLEDHGLKYLLPRKIYSAWLGS